MAAIFNSPLIRTLDSIANTPILFLDAKLPGVYPLEFGG